MRRILVAVAIVCLGALSGFLAARFTGHRDTAIATVDLSTPTRPAELANLPPQSTPATGESEAAAGAEPTHKIPTDIPDIALADPQGVKHRLAQWKGRPLLINFWATWCAPCRREIPLLKELRRERAADGLEVVGIAVDFRDAVQRYAREMGIDYPVLVGEQDGLDAIAAFGMDTVFPFTVFGDSRGRIVTLKVGELHADEARLILDQLKGVDQGHIELAAARTTIADGVAALAAQRARATAPDLSANPGQSKPEVP